MSILSTIEKCLDNAEQLNGELNSFKNRTQLRIKTAPQN